MYKKLKIFTWTTGTLWLNENTLFYTVLNSVSNERVTVVCNL